MNKKFCIALLAFIFVYASQARSEQQAALTSSQMSEMLYKGGSSNIVQVAQEVYNNKIEDPLILDTLAEYIYHGYAIVHPEPVSAVSWSCKALGESEKPRYYSILKEAAEQAGHAKVRKHCSKAADQIADEANDQEVLLKDSYQKGQNKKRISGSPDELLYSSNTLATKQQMVQEQIQSLVSDNDSRVRSTIQLIYSNKRSFPEVHDVIAELIQEFYDGSSFIKADTVAWACKALGMTRDARYEQVVYNSAKKGKRLSKSIYKHCKIAYKYNRGIKTSPHYIPGTVKLAELRNHSSNNSSMQSASSSSFEEKMRILKEMHDEGLLDNEAYRRKRNALLEKL